MLNYKPLPEFINNFIIRPADPFEIVKDIKGHNWSMYDTRQFLTDEGYRWFEENKIILKSKSQYFICNAHTTGPVHTDNPHKIAFNFVFEGYGNMEWVTVLDGDYVYHTNTVASGEKFTYKKFTEIRSIKINDTWNGQSALVKVSLPHRIVTKDSHRICISLRLDTTRCRFTFDEISQIINKQ
jgi:hypothetical protein